MVRKGGVFLEMVLTVGGVDGTFCFFPQSSIPYSTDCEKTECNVYTTNCQHHL